MVILLREDTFHFFNGVKVGCFRRSTRKRSSFFSNTFLHCPQWSCMDSCQANLGQRLSLDQVPEITGPGHFLWVRGISPQSWNTDLESVTRLSCPLDDMKKAIFLHFEYYTLTLAERRMSDHVDRGTFSIIVWFDDRKQI